jgi:hypothetical protein
MIRSLSLSLALVYVILLSSACTLSARSEGNVAISSGPATRFKAATSAFNPSEVLAFSSYTNSNLGYGNGDPAGGDQKGRDRNSEPPNLLSFGAALLIGGAVLYSRRMRRSRK